MSDTVSEEQETETADEVVNEVMSNDPQQTQDNDDSHDDSHDENHDGDQEQREEEKLPLSAFKKIRKELQEEKMRSELRDKELQQLKSMYNPREPQVDNSNDLLTVGEQRQTLEQWKRSILEEAYMEQHPDIVERIKEELPSIVSDPRHQWLTDSINQAPNRLQRAAQVLDMFKPKKQAAPAPDRTNVPRSPQAVAKTNKLSTADRIMSMSDQELEEWRISQKRKVR